MKLRISQFIPLTKVEGPGERACVYVQGCPIRCKGCAVPWTWSKDGGKEIDVKELTSRILNERRIQGVTFLGGEPFEQAAALAELGRNVKKVGLSVVTFTGYEMELIKSSDRKDWLDLIAVTDLLIDGPYRMELSDFNRPWVGSSNKKYRFLTDRYRSLENGLASIPNKVEVRILPTGEVHINGMIQSSELLQFGDSYCKSINSTLCRFISGTVV